MGDRVGPYELVRRLGKGGMGEVWLARATKLEGLAKWLAVKVIELAPDAGTDALLREARVALLLAHSNIVSVFDVGVDGDRGYVAMEWIDGVDLAHLVAGARAHAPDAIDERLAVFVVTRLLRALAYAHTVEHDGRALGLVHRDISPSNLIVSREGEVKLADFGIARSRLSTTTDGNVKGKVRYMAPEQFAGAVVDARADLFAVGAILHELLVGEPLRTGSSAAEIVAQIAELKLAPLPSVSPPIDELRRWLLQPDPSARVATAAEALEHLRRHGFEVDATHELAQLCQAITGRVRPTDGAGVLAAAPERGRTQNLDPDATIPASRGDATTRTHAPSPRSGVRWVGSATLAAAVLGLAALVWVIATREPEPEIVPAAPASVEGSPPAKREPAPSNPTPIASSPKRDTATTPLNKAASTADEIVQFFELCPVDADMDGVVDLIARVLLRHEELTDTNFALYDGHDGSLRTVVTQPDVDMDYVDIECVTGGFAMWREKRRNESPELELWSGADLGKPVRTVAVASVGHIRSEPTCVAVLGSHLAFRARTFEPIADCPKPPWRSGLEASASDGADRVELTTELTALQDPYQLQFLRRERVLWRREVVSKWRPAVAIAGAFVWVGTAEPDALSAYARDTGEPVPDLPLSLFPARALIVDSEKLLAIASRHACGLSLGDGAKRWCIGGSF
jgi:serine/threonine-protein kinase